MPLPDGRQMPPQNPYTFTETLIAWEKHGWRTTVKVGYPREKPEEKQVVIEKERKTKEGYWESAGGKFYIKSEEDWASLKVTVEKLWPELANSSTSAQIDAALASALEDKKLLDLVAQYPGLLRGASDDIEILAMPPEHKAALKQFLQASGEIAIAAIDKLKDEPATDVAGLVKILEGYRLATCNSLITTIKGRLAFIDTFEKLANDTNTYERRGDDSIHSLMAKNPWIIDHDYVILHSDVTLNEVVYSFDGDKLDDGSGNRRPDFVCLADGDENEIRRLIIIEIKKPGINIGLKHVDQVLYYKQVIETHSGRPIKSCEVYVVGSGVDPKLKSTPLDKSGVHVRTYSDMVAKARKFYREYYKIVEANPGSF
ncbi:MAG: hypothetical protein BWY29_00513 [Microgenomates group bacterium ADurb.Bin238]|nr:MAG: hypothetical protein BWY29_00513 [Microgenomates group bacterium ADurb.Bin238]